MPLNPDSPKFRKAIKKAAKVSNEDQRQFMRPKRRCIKCGKETDLAFFYDMDASGISTCKDCAEDVRYSIVMIACGLDAEVENFTKKWHEPIRINKPNSKN